MMKEELLKKVKEAIKEPIVGNYLFNANELEEIYSDAAILLQNFNGNNNDKNAVIFVALVNLTKEWKSEEDTFLDFIYRKFSSNYSLYQTIYSNLRTAITSLFDSNSIYMIEWGKRFYATLCSHAMAPISSTESFFDMCWEIYCNDLDQQYEKTDPVYALIVESLKNKFKFIKSLDDDIKIGSHAYSMRVGMKGLAIHAPKILEQLINDTICSIHSLFNYQPIKTDKYFKILLNDWWKRKQLTFGVSTRISCSKKEHTATTYSQIKTRFIYADDEIKVVVPPIRLLDNFENRPYLEIFADDELIHKEEMYTHGSGIIMSTLQREYPLSGIDFQNSLVRIVITHCGKKIYDSKESLSRDFILFKNGREVTSSECISGTYQLYVSNLEVLLRSPLGLEKVDERVYSFEAIDGEVIQSINKTVFFYNEQTNRNLYFFVRKKNNVIFKKDGLDYQVIDGELSVDVANSLEIGNIGIRYETTAFRLAEFPHTDMGSKTRYEITSLLNVGEPQKITVFKYGDNSVIASINIIKFNNVSITFDKDFYYGEGETGYVSFKTEKYFEEECFDANKRNISIPLEEGELIIDIPVIRWKIDNGEWNYRPSEKNYWFKNIDRESILYLDIPNDITCSIALSNNKELQKQDSKQKYELGMSIQSLASNELIKTNSLRIFAKINSSDFIPLFEIAFTENFMTNPLTIYQHDFKIGWNPSSFVGDDSSSFEIRIYEEDTIVDIFEMSMASRIINCFDFNEGKYIAKIFLISGNSEKELFSHSFIFGDEKSIRFKNRVLFINTVVTIDKTLYRKQIRPIFIDKIEYLGSKEGFDYYSGFLFVVDKEGKHIYLNKMRDSKGIVSIINPVRIELKTEHSCYIGYGLDANDPEFEYDNEFSIDYYGRTVIGNFIDGKKTSPVDYYIFEVKKPS